MPERRRMLELALKGLEAERAAIDDEIIQIKSQLNLVPATERSAVTASPATAPPKKRRMSAAARRKISEGQKRRYAEIKKAGPHSHGEAVGPKHSASGRPKSGSRL